MRADLSNISEPVGTNLKEINPYSGAFDCLNHLICMFQEAVREAEGVALSLEQSKKREHGLEAEARRLAEEKADALRLLKELQGEQ